MANIRSAEKRNRQNLVRNARNQSNRSRLRTFVRKCEEAFASQEQPAAASAFLVAQKELARAAQKGIIHSKTASRKISRLHVRLKSISA